MVIQEFLAWEIISSDCPFLRSESCQLQAPHNATEDRPSPHPLTSAQAGERAIRLIAKRKKKGNCFASTLPF